MRSLVFLAGLMVFACSQESEMNASNNSGDEAIVSEKTSSIEVNPNKNAYFGDSFKFN